MPERVSYWAGSPVVLLFQRPLLLRPVIDSAGDGLSHRVDEAVPGLRSLLASYVRRAEQTTATSPGREKLCEHVSWQAQKGQFSARHFP